MPRRPVSSALRPLKASQSADPIAIAAGIIAQQRKVAESMLARTAAGPILPDVMTADHPIARAIGFDQANALVTSRAVVAAKRRDAVREMSRRGARVNDIALELGLSCRHVVALRGELGCGRVR